MRTLLLLPMMAVAMPDLATASDAHLRERPAVPVSAARLDDERRTTTHILRTARRLVGTRYRYGGNTPREGFDCSGFVRHVFAHHGIELPRTARAMSRVGRRLPARLDDLRPGDLLFFAQGSKIDHVAIYLGNGRVVHASSGARTVRTDDLRSPRGRWFLRRLVGARRVLG